MLAVGRQLIVSGLGFSFLMFSLGELLYYGHDFNTHFEGKTKWLKSKTQAKPEYQARKGHPRYAAAR